MDLSKLTVILCVCCFTTGLSAEQPDQKDESFDLGLIKSLKHCVLQKEKMDCLKRKVIEKLDEQLKSNKTLEIADGISIKKDPQWQENSVVNSQRSLKGLGLNEILINKLNDYVSSLVIQFKVNDNNVEESRRRKNRYTQILMYGAVGIFGVLSQLFIGKLAVISGAALMIAKIALVLALLSGLKKLTGDGTDSHVVVTASEHGGHGGHGGGWSRSATAHDVAYRSQRPRPIMEMNPSLGYSVYEESSKGELDPSGK